MTVKSRNTSELAWLAQCYVLGELSAEQVDSFENRLAEDQTARDAVANAVALLAEIHSAQVGPIVVSRLTPHPSWKAWVGIATCACLFAFAFGSSMYFRGLRLPIDQARQTVIADDRQWIQDVPEILASTMTEVSMPEDEPVFANGEADETVVPAWLMEVTAERMTASERGDS